MADETISTRIVANADFSSLIADVHKVTASLSKLQEQLANSNKMLANNVAVINRNFSDTIRSTGQFSSHFVSLTSDVEKFGRNLDGGRLKLRDYFSTYQSHIRTSGGLIRELARQQVAMQNAVLQPLGRNAQGLMQFNVHVPRGLDAVKSKTAIARQELQIMNKVIQDGAVQLINWGKNTQWAGRQLTVGLTLPLAAFGKAAADAFKEADQELTRLTKVYGDIAGTSQEELGRVRQEVIMTSKELSAAYGTNFKETISLAADIAATGKQGQELLDSVKETSRLAVLGEVDRQEAMKATLAIQSAFKQNTDELADSINFLNAVENQTSTTLNDLVEAIPKAGPIIKGLGGSVQDLALYLTAMREGGINATEGANALKSALASLINPTDKAVEKFQGFGIDLLGIVNSNAGNVTGTLMELQSALDRLDPLQKQQAIEQLFGKFQFSRLNALFENLGRQGSQTLQVLDLMKASSQDLANVAGRELTAVTESASGKYRRAVESLKADLAGLGESFLTIGTNIINVIDKALEFFSQLPKPIKQALTFVGALTAVAGPLIMLTGVLANFFGYILKGVMHMKAFFKGGEGWKYLTPEMLAAEKAGRMVEQSFYSDAKAAAILKTALGNLIDEFSILEAKARTGAMSVNPAVSTMAGNLVMGATGGRVVNPQHPLAGAIGTRASTHMVPRAGLTEEQRLQQTIFGLVPGSIPVNRKIGDSPQIYMTEQLPNVPGLTTVGGVSTGVVAGEAARHHAMMATLAMQSKSEIEALKKQMVATGVLSKDFMGQFDDMLPIISKITDNAARESALIVAELRAGKISVEAAKAKIIALNLEIERMIGTAAVGQATSLGRTLNPTMVPTLNQPVVDPTGKSNMRELFKKSKTRDFIDKVARSLGVRTSGAGYNIETTRPRKMNSGGYVYTMNDGSIVPGPNVNSDVVPAMLTPGEFVVNREATQANLPLLMEINNNRQAAGDAMAVGGIAGGFRALSSLVGGARRAARPGVRPSVRIGYEPGALNYEQMALRAGRNRVWDDPLLALGKPNADEVVGHIFTNDFYRRMGSRAGRASSPQLTSSELLSKTGVQLSSRSGYSGLYDILPNNYMTISKEFNRSLNSGNATAQQWLNSNRGPQHLTSLLSYLTSQGVPANTALTISNAALNKINLKISKIRGPISEAMFGNIVTNTSSEVVKNSPLLSKFNSSVRGIHPNTYSIHSRGRSTLLNMPLNRMGNTWSNPRYIGGQVNDRNYIRVNRGGMIRMNRGGMVPGYQNGGPVSAFTSGLRNPYGRGLASGGLRMPTGMLGQTAISMGGFYAGQAVGGAAGTGIMIASSILPLMSGLRGLGGILPMITKLAGVLGRLTIPGAVIGGAFMLGKFLLDAKRNAEETAKANRQAFGMSADVIKKAGYSITDYNANIKDALESLKALRERNRMLYESMFQAGIPIKMTIAEYKKLRAEVKEGMPDLIKTFNVAPNASTASVATSLKAQFMALGDDIDTATAKVYALMSQSNKAQFAAAAIGSKGFAAIKTSIDAAIASAGNFDRALSEGETKAAADALIVTFEGIGNAIEDNAKKNKISFGQSMDEVLSKMTASGKGQVAITKDALNELKKQNPELARIINSTDTATSAWAKYQLALKNVNIDLQTLSAQAAQSALKLNDLATTQTIASLKSTPGISKQYAAYDKMLARIKDLTKATKGQSAAAEISTRKQIEALNKQINAIKKAADEKIKALRSQAQAEDDNLEIQKLQLEYQQALARGDKDAAASAQIALQQFTNQVQTRKAEEAIQAKADLQIKPLQDKIDALGKKNQDLADKAALAGDSLSRLQGEAEKLKSKLDAVETAGIAALFEALLNKDNPKYQGSKKQLETLSALDKAVVEAGGVSSLKTTNTRTHPKQTTNLFKTEFTDKSGGSKNIIDQAVKEMSVQAQVVNLIGEIKSGTSTGTGSKDSPKIISKDYSSSVTRGGMGGRLRAEQLIKENKLRAGQYIKYNDIDYEVLTDNILKPVGQRAAGGPVSAGSLYRVNETNMEFFRPNISGSILPSGTYPLGASYNIPSSAPSSVGNAGANNSFNNNVYNIDIDLNGTNVTADDIMRRFKSELALIGAREGRSRVVGGSY
jgi:TP901 family phage tail tape measure protein